MRILIIKILLISSVVSLGQVDQLKQADQLFENSKFEDAYSLYKEVGNIHFANESYDQYVISHLKMIECQLQLGDPFLAKNLALNTFDFINAEMPDQKVLKARCLTQIGLSYLNLGHNDDALENLLQAESTFLNEDSDDRANCLDAIGQVYNNNENKQLAIQYLEQAFKMRRKLFGPQSIEAANSYNNLGQVFLKTDPLQAIIYFNRAKGIYEDKLGNNSIRALRANLNRWE